MVQLQTIFSLARGNGCIHFSLKLETRVDIQSYSGVHHLLKLINEKLGHFDLSSEDGTPMFGHIAFKRSRPTSVEQPKIWLMFQL